MPPWPLIFLYITYIYISQSFNKCFQQTVLQHWRKISKHLKKKKKLVNSVFVAFLSVCLQRISKAKQSEGPTEDGSLAYITHLSTGYQSVSELILKFSFTKSWMISPLPLISTLLNVHANSRCFRSTKLSRSPIWWSYSQSISSGVISPLFWLLSTCVVPFCSNTRSSFCIFGVYCTSVVFKCTL